MPRGLFFPSQATLPLHPMLIQSLAKISLTFQVVRFGVLVPCIEACLKVIAGTVHNFSTTSQHDLNRNE